MKKAFFTAVLLAFITQAMLLAQQVIDVDLYTLLSEWEDNSLRAKQQYGNKTIRTTGIIYSITTGGSILLQVNPIEQYFMTMMMMGLTDTTLWVYFNKAEMAKLVNLNKEQSITVRGIYDGDRNVIRNAIIDTAPPQQSQQQQPPPPPRTETPPPPRPSASPPQQQTQTNIQGAWELRNDGVLWVIYFVDDTFVIYRNGARHLDGIYVTGVTEIEAFGIRNARAPNRTQNLFLTFYTGAELDAEGFSYEINSNELILSNDGFNSYNANRVAGMSGTYRRSSFAESEAENPLIGVWKREAGDRSFIFRFFPNGRCSFYGYAPQKGLSTIGIYTYRTGTGRLARNDGNILSYTVNGNILLIEGQDEFRRR
jgi:hypothetical protein